MPTLSSACEEQGAMTFVVSGSEPFSHRNPQSSETMHTTLLLVLVTGALFLVNTGLKAQKVLRGIQ